MLVTHLFTNFIKYTFFLTIQHYNFNQLLALIYQRFMVINVRVFKTFRKEIMVLAKQFDLKKFCSPLSSRAFIWCESNTEKNTRLPFHLSDKTRLTAPRSPGGTTKVSWQRAR